MSTIQLRIKVDAVKITVDKATLQDAWNEHVGYDEDSGDDPTEPSDEFVIETVQEEFESGERDLSEAFENASVEVEIAE